eukprot:CAMPEP_0119072406 /NCGR_PEP_ID=MMETSP1178-20130426/58350_1 /TAXON_ID=33656 /ORGANISM="unid sp, Strain CCMP2000" /LENGTH=124 /DNA_ID=CAMNT_0007054405 /DNA_START=194 /DNA_END=564 /DNA_ORIENTATION=-
MPIHMLLQSVSRSVPISAPSTSIFNTSTQVWLLLASICGNVSMGSFPAAPSKGRIVTTPESNQVQAASAVLRKLLAEVLDLRASVLLSLKGGIVDFYVTPSTATSSTHEPLHVALKSVIKVGSD